VSWSVLQSFASSVVTTTTASATPGSNLSSGSKLIAFCGMGYYGTPAQLPSGVKDANSNVFTRVAYANGTAGSSTFYPSISVWVLDTPSGDVGAKPAITVTGPAGPAGLWILVHEVSGLLAGTTAAVDGTPGTFEGAISGTSVAQPSYTSGAASELLYSLGCQDGISDSLSISGYTLDTHSPQPGSNAQGQVAYKNSTGGAESGTWTYSSTSGGDTAFLVLAFKLAAVASAAAPHYISQNSGMF
jgi:hypothetical protein